MPDDYHNKLKKLIEETYTINGKTPVTILSHSYGCAVTLYFLSLQTTTWKAKYLKQWIPLSGNLNYRNWSASHIYHCLGMYQNKCNI